jgi:hypothetical protein
MAFDDGFADVPVRRISSRLTDRDAAVRAEPIRFFKSPTSRA